MKKRIHARKHRLVGVVVLILCFSVAALIFLKYSGNRNIAVPFHKNVNKTFVHPGTSLETKPLHAEDTSLTKSIARVRSAFNLYLDDVHFSGTAVLVSHGHVVLDKGYGYRNVRLHLPNKPSTEYYIGSITKSVTAVAFMQMRQQGLISFNTHVSQFYPDFPNGRSISMLDLLCHVSGLRGIPETSQYVTRDEQVQRIADWNLRLSYRPGSRWSYQDDNYTLVASILDKVSLKAYGETLHQFIQKNIFDKAHMTHAGFKNAMLQSSYRSFPYTGIISKPIPSFTQLFGCGDVYMSAWDLYLFDQALADGTLLSDASYHTIFQKHFNVSDYTLGWYLNRAGWGNRTYSSHGVLGGWNGSNAFSMDRQNFVVLLSNSSRTSGIFAHANYMTFDMLSK
ncbi:class A beta-lactamase-related serine hydrolase [Sporolactobacillus shoreae]|uniref:Class A beta-lactamase-related serine hydrolase n=1 Tax=Sporolactobacillus shoreae TaxID=1465501 RepID=A0A4Z0GQX9_9BACL|nr:serine hydrolase domain-containing protein [Sporolactobacillus shoreae]TGA98846.1 class A beta-lactamase-related serine hydrolase [Sporolactobacillus shoreae]